MIPPLYVNQPSLCATLTFILHTFTFHSVSHHDPHQHVNQVNTSHTLAIGQLINHVSLSYPGMHFQGGAIFISSSTVVVSSSSFTSNTLYVSGLIVCCYVVPSMDEPQAPSPLSLPQLGEHLARLSISPYRSQHSHFHKLASDHSTYTLPPPSPYNFTWEYASR